MKNLCPVCGYWELPRPAQDDLICPCCGTHFGYHDYATTYEELRAKWLAGGARWFSRALPTPANWDPYLQLANAQMIFLLKADIADIEDSRTEPIEDDQPMSVCRWSTAAPLTT